MKMIVANATSAAIRPYVAVLPKPRSASILDAFFKSIEAPLPGPVTKRSELHITVMYSTNECLHQEIRKSMNPNREYTVELDKAEIFENKEAQNAHLVLRVKAPELSKFHYFLKQTFALRPTFDYKPHITICSGGSDDGHYDDVVDQLEAARDEINRALDGKTIKLAFTKEYVEPIQE